jgi:hypothetical protein
MQYFLQVFDLKHYFDVRLPIQGRSADFLWPPHQKFAHIWGKHLLICLPLLKQSRA